MPQDADLETLQELSTAVEKKSTCEARRTDLKREQKKLEVDANAAETESKEAAAAAEQAANASSAQKETTNKRKAAGSTAERPARRPRRSSR